MSVWACAIYKGQELCTLLTEQRLPDGLNQHLEGKRNKVMLDQCEEIVCISPGMTQTKRITLYYNIWLISMLTATDQDWNTEQNLILLISEGMWMPKYVCSISVIKGCYSMGTIYDIYLPTCLRHIIHWLVFLNVPIKLKQIKYFSETNTFWNI